MSKPNNIFISWSGGRSKFVAEALKDWLPHVLQSARPWLSTRDIEKGTRSLTEMNKALGGMGFGMSCLTPENLKAPWVLFEAGALSKAFDDDKARLWTYLLGNLEPQDVEPPLSQFQHTKAEKEETRKLIHSMNTAINSVEDRLEKNLLDDTFNQWWPKLEKELKDLPSAEKLTEAKRDPDEILTEILNLCRLYLPRIDALDKNVIRQSVPLSALSGTDFNPGLANLANIGVISRIPGLASSNTPSKRTFYVKLFSESLPKTIEGANAIEPHAGGLIVLDEDNNVLARFSEGVEQWY